MANTSCLAGIDEKSRPLLRDVVRKAGAPKLTSVVRLNINEIGALAPTLLVCDIDGLAVDPLERLRQVRFVLPECIIAVYTSVATQAWALACHVAGASCLLSKESTRDELVTGITTALTKGCYTDPRFEAPAHASHVP